MRTTFFLPYFLTLSIVLAFGLGSIELAAQSEESVAEYTLFSAAHEVSVQDVLARATAFTLDLKQSRLINLESPEDLVVRIPMVNGTDMEIILSAASAHFAETTIELGSQKEDAKMLVSGMHYTGRLKGKPKSSVALSIFPNAVMGMIITDNKTYTLGKWEGQKGEQYILYETNDLLVNSPVRCHLTESQATAFEPIQEDDPVPAEVRCVRLYIEVDYNIFQQKGNISNTAQYISGLFNQVALLYANDGMVLKLSKIKIWDIPSPYKGPTAGHYLNQFMQHTQDFDGDVAHLVGYGGSGGIAYVRTLCNANADVRKGYSKLHSHYVGIPVYSWSVHVLAHENGHLLGSRHTQDCVWNGNHTAIDGCYQSTNGCPIAPIPANGGTIMSYCHLRSVGINFGKGFGPQPAALMRQHIARSSCLSTCGITVDTTATPADTSVREYVCGAQGKNTKFEYIDAFGIHEYTHISGDNGGYGDFTDQVACRLVGGHVYEFMIRVGYGTTHSYENFRIWLDANGDHVFDARNELLFDGRDTTQIFGNLTIPEVMGTDTVTLRIIVNYGRVPAGPCDTFIYGEVEDYSIILTDSMMYEDTLSCNAGTRTFLGDTSVASGFYADVDTVWFEDARIEIDSFVELQAYKLIHIHKPFYAEKGSAFTMRIVPCTHFLVLPETEIHRPTPPPVSPIDRKQRATFQALQRE